METDGLLGSDEDRRESEDNTDVPAGANCPGLGRAIGEDGWP